MDQLEMRLLQFSVVVVGKVHNPSILNPDFLRLRHIVPDEWGWEVADGGLTTPPLALVPYKQGTVITVEHDKLQVVDDVTADPRTSKAVDIASQYVKTLPHVRYTGVGINFQVAIETGDPRSFLRERFLKPGSWDSHKHSLEALGMRFVYPLECGRLVASFDMGEVVARSAEKSPAQETGSAQPRSAVIVGANFHRNCTQYPSDAEAIHHLSRVNECWQSFTKLLADTLDVEWTAHGHG